MVSALHSGASAQGCSPGQGHFVGSWQETLLSRCSFQAFKWVPACCSAVGLTCDGIAPRPGGVEILLVASCHGKQDKLPPNERLGSYADLTILSLCFYYCRIALLQRYTQGLALKFRMAITCRLNIDMFEAKGRYDFFTK